MGAPGVLKTLVITAAISLSFYLLLSHLIVPLWQRYRNRYSQYLPLETISAHSTSLRQRIQATLARFLLPSSWRSDSQPNRFVHTAGDESDGGFDDDDGEELFEVDENRREALSLDARRGQDDDGRRLSRDLEEGFRDDSDQELDSDNARDGPRNG